MPWAELPRLTGAAGGGRRAAGGTTLHVSLAALTGYPGSVVATEAVARVVADRDAVEVVWADDGARTRVPFEPVGVTHTAGQHVRRWCVGPDRHPGRGPPPCASLRWRAAGGAVTLVRHR